MRAFLFVRHHDKPRARGIHRETRDDSRQLVKLRQSLPLAALARDQLLAARHQQAADGKYREIQAAFQHGDQWRELALGEIETLDPVLAVGTRLDEREASRFA